MRSRILTLGSLVAAGLSAAIVIAQGEGLTHGGPLTFVGGRDPAPPPNSSSAVLPPADCTGTVDPSLANPRSLSIGTKNETLRLPVSNHILVVSKFDSGSSSFTAGFEKKSLASQKIAHRRPATSLGAMEEYSSTLLLNVFRFATTSLKWAQ
eukprot:scaffold262463_cov60-Attheya_sp.AAC.1